MENQKWRQLPFYQKDIVVEKKGGMTHLRERLNEFADGFDNFKYLNNMHLGNVLELGCGAYTQLRNIMEVTTLSLIF